MSFNVQSALTDADLREIIRQQRADIVCLREQVAALESREVCTVAHDDVETCGYCQRDALRAVEKAARDYVEYVKKADIGPLPWLYLDDYMRTLVAALERGQ